MSTPMTAETFTALDDLDPATPGDPFTRPRYFYGQLLGAEDFETEQRYHLLRSRLRNALLHGVGTVWGLAVSAEETTEPVGLRLLCDPGLAIDPLGRELYVPQRLCLDLTGLASTPFWKDLSAPPVVAGSGAADGGDDDLASDSGAGGGSAPEDPRRRVYVVLSYRACLREPVPAVTSPCSDNGKGLVASRVLDGYRVCLQAEAPPDPTDTVRDIGARKAPPSPRERLLAHVLNLPIDGTPVSVAPLSRFWSGADEAPLLLAVLDLEPVGNPVERVKLAGEVDNGVRALLPAVQALADLTLGIRLDGAPGPAAPQALGVSAAKGTGADAGHMLIAVQTSTPLDADSLKDPDSARVLRWDAAAPGWKEPSISRREATASGLRLVVDEDWTLLTPYQVLLAGTGPHALLDAEGRLLAGVAGESVPPGSGRDASLSATYNPAP